MMLIVITSIYPEYVQRSGDNLYKHEKVFQIIGIVLPDEKSIKCFTFIFQSFYLNFKSTFTIFKEFMSDFWNNFRRTSQDDCFC